MGKMMKGPVLVGLALLLLGMPLLAACKGGTITAPAVTVTRTVTATPSPTTPAATTTRPPTTTPAPAKEVTVKVGVGLPLTGALAGHGIAIERGIRMAEAEVNKQGIEVGGVKYKLAFSIGDDGYTADKGVALANKYLFTDNMNILANFGTVPTAAVAPLLKGKDVLYFSQGSAPVISPDYPNNFRAGLLVADIFYPSLVKWFKQNHPEIKKVALIIPEGTDNVIAIPFVKAAEYNGIEVVGDERHPRTLTEFSPIIAKVMTANPDAIVITATGPTGNIAKQLREKGYKGLIWLASNADADFVKIAGAAALEGAFAQNIDTGSPLVPEAVRNFIKEYKDKYGTEPTTFAIDFYSIPHILASAIKKAGSAEIRKLVEVMGTQELDSPWGKFRFAGKDLYGIDRQGFFPLVVSEFRQGEPKMLALIKPDELIADVKAVYGTK